MRRVGKGALAPCPPIRTLALDGGHAALCPPYETIKKSHCVIASEASNPCHQKKEWIASRSLSSGAHSRDPVARNDVARAPPSSSAVPRPLAQIPHSLWRRRR